MTPQEAIEILQTTVVTTTTKEQADKYREAIMQAREALEKQIPKKIKEVHVDEYFCPACWAENNCCQGIVEDEFCPNCGQALDREDKK